MTKKRRKTSTHSKPKQKTAPLTSLGRACPLGQHWVSKHPRNRISSRGLAYIQSVNGYCRTNRSGKDHLYRDEIQSIAKRGFIPFNLGNLKKLKSFRGKDEAYDSLIVGWTHYWNQIFNMNDPLDPETVKALIASESSFDKEKWNHQKGKDSATGLMQVTNRTLQLLRDPKELKDHLLTLTEEDMKDPNLAICGGIRWLFRKREVTESQLRRKPSWKEVVHRYKGYKSSEKNPRGMKVFDTYLLELKESKQKAN